MNQYMPFLNKERLITQASAIRHHFLEPMVRHKEKIVYKRHLTTTIASVNFLREQLKHPRFKESESKQLS